MPLLAAAIGVAKPEDAGMSSERLARIRSLVPSHIPAKDISGAVTLVARRGKVVHVEAHGLADLETGRPMQTGALFRMASMTKPLTAVSILMLMEEGKLLLSDPVCRTIRQDRARRWEYSPGTGFDTLGRIIEMQSGTNLAQFFKARIFDPLGMKDSFFDITEARRGDLVVGYAKSDKGLSPSPPPIEIVGVRGQYYSGAGGMTSTAQDYLQFSQMLLNNGPRQPGPAIRSHDR